MSILFKTRLGQLIAQMEGFNTPNSLPARRHNPGDLRHSLHGDHTGIGQDDIAIEPSDAVGEADMERQFSLDASRGMTLKEFVYTYAPPSENDSNNYLNFICNGLGMQPDSPLRDAMRIPPVGTTNADVGTQTIRS